MTRRKLFQSLLAIPFAGKIVAKVAPKMAPVMRVSKIDYETRTVTLSTALEIVTDARIPKNEIWLFGPGWESVTMSPKSHRLITPPHPSR